MCVYSGIKISRVNSIRDVKPLIFFEIFCALDSQGPSSGATFSSVFHLHL